MPKSQLYKQVQDFFPSELGVGDIVKFQFGKKEYTIVGLYDKWLRCLLWDGVKTKWAELEDLKLIRKNITLSMVLFALVIKGIWFKVIPVDIEETDIVDIVFSEREDDKIVRWQLRKDGKDLSLYDQSIELIKLVIKILENKQKGKTK